MCRIFLLLLLVVKFYLLSDTNAVTENDLNSLVKAEFVITGAKPIRLRRSGVCRYKALAFDGSKKTAKRP